MNKNLVFIIGLLILSTGSLQAQYEIYRHYYSPNEYEYHYDDRYNPGLCGVASLAVPGLGQIIAGESRRGVTFMGGTAVLYIITYSGALIVQASDPYDDAALRNGSLMFLGGVLGLLAVDIWATVDAVRVAKVNNLAIRELRKTSFNMRPALQVGYGGKPAPGLAMSLGF